MVSAAKARAHSSCSEHPTHSRRGARVTAGSGPLESLQAAPSVHTRGPGGCGRGKGVSEFSTPRPLASSTPGAGLELGCSHRGRGTPGQASTRRRSGCPEPIGGLL